MQTGVDHLVPEQPCPACGRRNRGTARYCANCGATLVLSGVPNGTPGRTVHPKPLPPPAGFVPCLDAGNLYVRWQHGNEPPALGVEAVTVDVFNGGYDLRSVILRLVGLDDSGKSLCSVEQSIADLPRSATVRVEVPSYEVSSELKRLIVSLALAEWATV